MANAAFSAGMDGEAGDVRKPVVLGPGVRAGALNFGVPGGFEEMMPAIVGYFAEHPPGRA
jgi:hypothetical protein